jgi:excinuclease ABC subunit A
MEATGISYLLKKIVSFRFNEITKYAFDIKSITGKCITCDGNGEIYNVEKKFFIKDGSLTSDCKKFLRNSTDYVPISKFLKKDKIDIIKKYADLSDIEQQVLLFGYDTSYEIEGKPRVWKGLINNFINQHKYYPNKESENIFSNRIKITCPTCNGKMLKKEFQNIKCNGLSYSEWMTLSISELLTKIDISDDVSNENSKLMFALKTLKTINLGNLKLSDTLASMDGILAGKIKFVSLYLNRIYGVGIVIKNIEVLTQNDKKIIEEIAKECSDTNTVWIV